MHKCSNAYIPIIVNYIEQLSNNRGSEYQLWMHMELFFHGRQDCSALDGYSSPPTQCSSARKVLPQIRKMQENKHNCIGLKPIKFIQNEIRRRIKLKKKLIWEVDRLNCLAKRFCCILWRNHILRSHHTTKHLEDPFC